ncbi:MAG: hypothetical protein AABP62_12270 [Planctomycetota bacterium]
MPAASEDEDFEIRQYRRSFVLKIVLIGAIVVVVIGMGSLVVLTVLFPMAAARRERALREKLEENEKLKEKLRQIGIGLHNNEQTQQQRPPSERTDGVPPDSE